MTEIEEREIPMPTRGENGKASILVSLPDEARFKVEPGDESTYPFTLPPIILLHGSFHGAWCWEEHYIPYFVQLGYPVVALNFRGAGAKDETATSSKVTIQEHCEDLHCFLQQIPSLFTKYSCEPETASEEQAPLPPEQAPTVPLVKPILISHSFGGIVLMKYLEGEWTKQKAKDSFSAIIVMCSLPPSGMSRVSNRMMWRSIGDTWKMVQGMAMKKFVTDPALCRDMFFGGPSENDDVDDNTEATIAAESPTVGAGDNAEAEEGADPDADADANTAVTADTTVATEASSITLTRIAKLSDAEIQKFQEYFARDTRVSTDTRNLPWPSMKVDRLGRAPFVGELPPCLVVGGKQDFMVDEKGCIETAKYFGLIQEGREGATRDVTEEKRGTTKHSGPLMVDAPHDLMLVPHWQDIADELQAWIQSAV